jgi:hypothetical protein
LSTGTTDGCPIFQIAGTAAAVDPFTSAEVTIIGYARSAGVKIAVSSAYAVTGSADIGRIHTFGVMLDTAMPAITKLELLMPSGTGSFLDTVTEAWLYGIV